ncbi:branched-chain amino acid ABC transporter permease [Thermaerobacter sp. PB12/4term]|uniref:branched-chain amino acid ABC transporter permease n=1 Tax=Thermaerobacter sp. PB12/4term TaxID=2293838 RepID=UPI000E326A2C|nr:branched-chain amino acid ABC transporter permease [Thermaerobacter sp. PB12/4term]QIA26531.1 branched-chain amino acid ABC transporter permease [Thermaerobacter sp. PB12/4term]
MTAARPAAGQALPRVTATRDLAVAAALTAFLIALPLAGWQGNLRLIFTTLLWTTCSIAWNLVGGFAGQVSFGFAVFYGLGAYTAAVLITAGHVNPYLSLAGAALVAAAASLLIGLPTFRLRGPYFAIATIGVNEAVRVVMNNLEALGAASGYRVDELAGGRRVPFVMEHHYLTAVVIFGLALVVSILVARSRFGLALNAIRDDEDAAADTGINPFLHKLAVHALAAALVGAAGGAYARYAAFIDPSGVFNFNNSVSILLMPVIGGLATIWGPVIGGAVYGIVQEELVARFAQIHLGLYGALLILVILFEPGGVVGLARRIWKALVHRRATGAPVQAGGVKA